MPNVDPDIGHGFAILRPNNSDALTQRYSDPVLMNGLTKEKLIFRQIQWKWPCRLTGNQRTIPAPRWVLGRALGRLPGRQKRQRNRQCQCSAE